jgi:hypothetical protein
MRKIIIIVLILTISPIIGSAQRVGGQVRRSVKKPQNTSATSTKKNHNSKNEGLLPTIIQDLVNNMVHGGAFTMGGGSWHDLASNCRVSNRFNYRSNLNVSFGFRLAL